MVKAKRKIIETTGVEVGSSVRPMPSAAPYPPRFSNPPPLSAFYAADERDDWQEAADLGRSIGQAFRAGVGLALLVSAVVDGADKAHAKARGRR